MTHAPVPPVDQQASVDLADLAHDLAVIATSGVPIASMPIEIRDVLEHPDIAGVLEELRVLGTKPEPER